MVPIPGRQMGKGNGRFPERLFGPIGFTDPDENGIFSLSDVLTVSLPYQSRKEERMFREKIDAVKAIPGQIQTTMILAVTALLVALIALSMTMVGGYRAN